MPPNGPTRRGTTATATGPTPATSLRLLPSRLLLRIGHDGQMLLGSDGQTLLAVPAYQSFRCVNANIHLRRQRQ